MTAFNSQKKALILVDLQNDFCEGGALAVAGGLAVADRVAQYVETEGHRYDVLVVSQDWHKPDDPNGGHIVQGDETPDFVDTWPAHCLAGSPGAELVPVVKNAVNFWLYEDRKSLIGVKKGFGYPAYSAFDANSSVSWMPGSAHESVFMSKQYDLRQMFQELRIGEVHVMGLAYDHCVAATAIDSSKRQSTYQVTEVRAECCAAVNWLTAVKATRKMVAARVEVML